MGEFEVALRRFALAGIITLVVAGAACDHRTAPVEPTPLPCTFVLSTSSLSFDAPGGSASVTVTAAAGCAWSATSDHAWMSIVAGATGTGNGAVEVSVDANPTSTDRTAALTIAGQSVAVRVAGLSPAPCRID